MSRDARKQVFGGSDQSGINTPGQSVKQAKTLKFRMYYPCSENKGADLRLCFRIGKNPVLAWRGSNQLHLKHGINRIVGSGINFDMFGGHH